MPSCSALQGGKVENTTKIAVKCMGKIKRSMPKKFNESDCLPEYFIVSYKDKIPSRDIFVGQISQERRFAMRREIASLFFT